MTEKCNPSRVAIIGAGRIGQALHSLAARAHTVEMWDVDSTKVSNQKSLTDVLAQTDIVFLGVPSWALRQALVDCAPHLLPGAILVSLSKGLEEGSGKRVDEVLAEALPPGQPFALLSGPMMAEEMAKGLGALGVLAAAKEDDARRVAACLGEDLLRVVYSPDLKGVALAGVLKNVYALALGISDGLGWGGNLKGWLANYAMQEMARVLRELHGSDGALFLPAGYADFLATGYSPHSRNRTMADELVRTGVCSLKSEGCASLPALVNQVGDVSRYPLLAALNACVLQGAKPREAFEALLP